MSGGAQTRLVERVTSTAAQRAGDAAEALVAERLAARGWTILARNVRVGRAELDLVAVDPGPPRTLVILEVRRRGRRDFGLAEETIGHRKRVVLRRGIAALLERAVLPSGDAIPQLPLRVDLVALDVDPEGRSSIRHHRAIPL